MKKVILFLALSLSFLIGFSQTGNDTTLYTWYKYTYGVRYDRLWPNKVLQLPQDTTFSKDGLAVKGGILYIGNGIRWSAAPSGSGGIALTDLSGLSPIGYNNSTGVFSLDTNAAHLYGAVTQAQFGAAIFPRTFLAKRYLNAYGVFAPFNTDSIPEGANKYFTNTLARLAISGSLPISYNNSTGVISIDTSTTGIHSENYYNTKYAPINASADSSIFQTVYRSDTSRDNVYRAIGSLPKISGTNGFLLEKVAGGGYTVPIQNDSTNGLFKFDRALQLNNYGPSSLAALEIPDGNGVYNDIQSVVDNNKRYGYHITGTTNSDFSAFDVSVSADYGLSQVFHNNSTAVNGISTFELSTLNSQDAFSAYAHEGDRSFYNGITSVGGSSRYFLRSVFSSGTKVDIQQYDSLGRGYIIQSPRTGSTSDSVLVRVTATGEEKMVAQGSIAGTPSGLTNSNLSGSAGITNANLATMANNTIKGNVSGSTAVPSDITGSQVTGILDKGSSSTFGVVKVDNTTITAAGGVLSAVGGGGAINIKRSVWVDSSGSDATGAVANPGSPYRTMDSALVALKRIGGGVLYLGIGEFNSPVDSAWSDNITVIGKQRPSYNWVMGLSADGVTDSVIVSPTKLIGGSILHGQMHIILHNGIKFYNIGVDNGSAWVSGGGTEGDCLVIGYFSGGSATAPYTLPTDVVVENCSFLGKSPISAFHCLVIQRAYAPQVNNITTFYGTHGLAIKTVKGSYTNIKSFSSSTDGIILKADTYAACSGNILTNFSITAIAGQAGGGLFITNNSDVEMTGNSAYSGIISNTTYGVLLSNTLTQKINGSNLVGITVRNTTGTGFEVDSSYNVNIVGCRSSGNTGSGYSLHPSYLGPISLSSVGANNNGSSGITAVGRAPNGIVTITDAVSVNNTGNGISGSSPLVVADLLTVYGNASNTVSAGTRIPVYPIPGTTGQFLTNLNSGAMTPSAFFSESATGVQLNASLTSFNYPFAITNSGTGAGSGVTAILKASRSNTADASDNVLLGMQQKTNAAGNYATFDFFNSAFNTSAYIAAHYIDHTTKNTDIILGNVHSNVLTPSLVVKWSGNSLFGLNDTTERNAYVGTLPSNATTANLYLGGGSVDVSSPTNGMFWYNSTAHTLNFRDNGVTTDLLASGSAGTTYTPTLGTGSNVTAVTLGDASYSISGSTVHVMINGTFTATSINTGSNITFTLPVTASSTLHAGGVANISMNSGAAGYASGGTALLSTTSGTMAFQVSNTSSTGFTLYLDYQK